MYNIQLLTAGEIMPKYVKGQSGNPNGRPKGTGFKQRLHRQQVLEKVMLSRLDKALAELDRLHEERVELLTEFATDTGRFPVEDTNNG